jgi:hypothetical protein
LRDYPRCDAEVRKLAAELWGDPNPAGAGQHRLGRGKVVWGQPLAEVLNSLRTPPDFEYAPGGGDRLAFIHRQEPNADIYFVSNQRQMFSSVTATFRVAGKMPELWNAEQGRIEPAPVWQEKDGRTTIPLQFPPAGSLFVVFRHSAASDHLVNVQTELQPPRESARFQPQLRILKAAYGAFPNGGDGWLNATNRSQTADVTEKLTALLKDDTLSVTVENDLSGRDPAPNIVKELRVEYTLNGVRKTAKVGEHELMTLPESGTEIGRAPGYTVALAGTGPQVHAWTPGRFTLTTASGRKLEARCDQLPAPAELTGPWELHFPAGWQAPAQVTFETLQPWPANSDPGIKYFSGTATYIKEFEIPAERLAPDMELWLDLGKVKNFAVVSLNGQTLETLWKPPFCVNATVAARPGKNRLEIKVTNLWPNRLIGDEQLPPDCEWNGKQLKGWPAWLLEGKPSPTGRLTFTTWHHWTKDDALLDSGLLGPVLLRSVAILPAR